MTRENDSLNICRNDPAAAAYEWQTSAFTDLSPACLYAALRLRQAVFVVEQQCVYPDLDNLDQQAIHMLCWSKNELLAYQRCLAPGSHFPESAIGRVVVSSCARGGQLGRELVQRGIDHNLARWPGRGIRIHAQAYLRAFYCSLGFVEEGEPFDEDGIPHIGMRYAESV
jgi:ElaA protein